MTNEEYGSAHTKEEFGSGHDREEYGSGHGTEEYGSDHDADDASANTLQEENATSNLFETSEGVDEYTSDIISELSQIWLGSKPTEKKQLRESKVLQSMWIWRLS